MSQFPSPSGGEGLGVRGPFPTPSPSPLTPYPPGERGPNPSAARAFLALVWFALRRQGRVRQMGWVAFALLGVTVLVVGVVTHGGVGWRVENRERSVARFKPWLRGENRDAHVAVLGGAEVAADDVEPDTQRMTPSRYAQERLPVYAALPGPPDEFGVRVAVFAAYGKMMADHPADPARADHAAAGRAFRNSFALTNFSRWVVFTLYLAFLLPLFTLAYASAGIGAEREGRTLLWLTTRPLPRWAVYLGKLVGVLPWSVGVSGGAFVLLCLAGGKLGEQALDEYWPAVLGGAVTFTCVFHMAGALFRRPTIVGLVYVFFFETLVANLPGGLKQFSLNYYLKSLLYDRLKGLTTGEAPELPGVVLKCAWPEALETYQEAEPGHAWLVLVVVSVIVTALGAWLFGRQEPKDET